MSGQRARFAYLVTEKWTWLLFTPIVLLTHLGNIVSLISAMSAYALYLTADSRLEAARAHQAADQVTEEP